jgi:type I restriction enzyme S subunit
MLASERFGKVMHGRDLGRYRVAPRDSVVADPMLLWDGSIGLQTVVDAGLVSPDYRVYQPARGVDPTFLGYVVRSPLMLPHYQSGARGTNVRRNRIARTDFLAIPLKVPPLSEQKKIAVILSSLDEAIEATRAVIEQLQVVKNAMMTELLARGLPGRHTRFRQTEIGEVPEAWEVLTTERVTERVVVGIVIKPASYYVSSGVPALRSKNVRPNRIDLHDLVYISSESNQLLRKSQIRAGDVVTVRTGAPGTSCEVPDYLDGANCIDLIVSTPKEGRLLGGFLALLMNSYVGETTVALRKGGLAQQHFNVGAMKETPLPIPPLEEQKEIVATMNVLGAREREESKVRSGLESLKAALMSALLTGEVRVKPDEDAA